MRKMEGKKRKKGKGENRMEEVGAGNIAVQQLKVKQGTPERRAGNEEGRG